MKKKDRIVGLILMIIGISLALLTFIQIPSSASGSDPGARAFPLIGSIGLFICGLGVSINAKDKAIESFLDKAGWRRTAELCIAFALYVIVLKYVGFVIASPIFIFTATSLFEYDARVPIVKRLLFSIVTTAAIWFVFVRVLAVTLPTGIIF